MKYEDIIGLPHHVSKTRTPMPMENRAAQFAPFAALSGHDEAIAETARRTNEKVELSDDELRNLSRKLLYAYEKRTEITVICFRRDAMKSGGEYIALSGVIRKIDISARTMTFDDGRTVELDCVIEINRR